MYMRARVQQYTRGYLSPNACKEPKPQAQHLYSCSLCWTRQICSVTSPFFLSRATNALYAGSLYETMYYVGLYAILAFAAKALKEAQSLVYLK